MTFAFALDPCIIHGTPITPKRLLDELRGGSFCVSFARPDQLEECLALQGADGMLLLDNGAFSHWRAGKGAIDRNAFFAWANAVQDRCDVAVAVVPDVIEGSEQENWLEAAHAVRELSDYPERLMFVWHMDDSLAQLERACTLFNFVAIGSCAAYDVQRNRQAYMDRLREANHVINLVEVAAGRRPWIHLMRGLAVFKDAIRFESADSSNIARNHCRLKGKAERRAKVMHETIAAPILAAAASAPRGPTSPTSNFDVAEQQPVVELQLAA